MLNNADVIVVGSGPGGATAARELARAGRRVLLLERGRDERGRPGYGSYAGVLRYADRGGLLYSAEGMQIVRPLLLGGATSMYCGCATPPPAWLRARYGVDLEADVAATIAELGVAPLPPELRGAASTRIAEAGQALGLAWAPQPKLMAPPADRPFGCGAHCLLGCRCGAKWSAASFVDQARAAGAQVLTGVHVEHILHNGRRAHGVAAKIQGALCEIHAPQVILAAGGIGTPRILQASGVAGAGQGLTVDTTMLVYGVARGRGIASEPPMTWSYRDPDERFMLSTLIDPWLMYPLAVGPASRRGLASWARYGSVLGVMIKIRDERSGAVAPGAISKGATPADREVLAEAEQIARRLLVAAGADAGSLVSSGLRGTHPGSTARIGDLVDRDLASAIAGLYVCDASALPEALGQPTVLTIIGLARRLARRLGARSPRKP